MTEEGFVDKIFNAPEKRCTRFSNTILEYADSSRQLRILDLGCGTGGQLFELSKRLPHAQLTGVDISKPNIRFAEQRRKKLFLKERVTFHAMDYLNLKTGPFHIIISDSTLQNITCPTEHLFSKIDQDLLPEGYLITTMPYDCLYNRVLWTIRRMLQAIRSSMTDSLILTISKILYGRDFEDSLLEERIHYMYLIPKRFSGSLLNDNLRKNFALELIRQQPLPHESMAKPKHHLIVYRKRG